MRRMFVAAMLSATIGIALASSIYDLFEPLSLVDGDPAWGDLRLGSSLEDTKRHTGTDFAVDREVCDFCPTAVFSTTVVYEGRPLTLHFETVRDGELALAAIRIVRRADDSAASWERRTLLREVKKRLPGLKFAPGRHAPESREEGSDRPFFSLPTAPGTLVVVEPGYSISISKDTLYD